jgi:hypothetical protein
MKSNLHIIAFAAAAFAAIALLPLYAFANMPSLESDPWRNSAFVKAAILERDAVLASFERDMQREPVKATAAPAKVSPQEIAGSSLNLGNNAVVASFERDMLGNAVAAAPRAREHDPILASFERDMQREPVPVQMTAHEISAGDYAASSLKLGHASIVASFERDMLGNAVVAAPRAKEHDPILASFERDMQRDPVAPHIAPAQDNAQGFVITLANFGQDGIISSSERSLLNSLVCKLK